VVTKIPLSQNKIKQTKFRYRDYDIRNEVSNQKGGNLDELQKMGNYLEGLIQQNNQQQGGSEEQENKNGHTDASGQVHTDASGVQNEAQSQQQANEASLTDSYRVGGENGILGNLVGGGNTETFDPINSSIRTETYQGNNINNFLNLLRGGGNVEQTKEITLGLSSVNSTELSGLTEFMNNITGNTLNGGSLKDFSTTSPDYSTQFPHASNRFSN